MKRLTISMDDDLADALDRLIEQKGYENRSEAFRDMIRREAALERLGHNDSPCVAVASYVYNHHERQLAARLTEHQHEHGSLVVSLMHAHLGMEECLETVFLKGRASEVRAFARALIAAPGVRHGQINLIPTDEHPHGMHTHETP